MSVHRQHDPAEPLAAGRTIIEASAGTGKTYALSTLAARYVAEDAIAIAELLIVTFTRAAAAELKDRVRERLVDFRDALAAPDEPDDPLLRLVRSSDREVRLHRVETAITEFDSATITTIHGFAQQVIGTLGSTVPTDPDAVLVDDDRDLIRQVATDLLVAEAVDETHPADQLPDLTTLCKAAGLAMGNPEAVLVPGRDPQHSNEAAARLRVLVDEVTSTVDSRRRMAGTLSFDDLLIRLRNALDDARTQAGVRRTLADRYRVALIDEFQDTDPVQWAIFDAVFAGALDDGEGPGTSLILVGDPKQAIYAFRGANVRTYLQAAHAPGTSLTGLKVNWRSDPAVLAAAETLLSGTSFGAEEIRFQPVEAAPKHADRRLLTADGSSLPALSVRLAIGAGVPRASGTGNEHLTTKEKGTPVVYREMATYVRDLLESAVIPDDDQGDDITRPLRPDDVAVLISANREGPIIRDALMALGIPAVISRGDNVLESEAADHWHRLLAGVARPADPRRARAAALSWFVGWDGNRTAEATDLELSTVQEQLLGWGARLSTHGVAAFLGQVWAESAVTSRVLGRVDGDRAMTDLQHIAELLVLAGGRSASPTTLLATFEQLAGGDQDGDPEADLAARRVESESRAVQIMTTFVAKGLEFPVVCMPSSWNNVGATAYDNVWWDEARGRRTIDLASDIEWGPEDARAERTALAAREAVGSNLRVLYVALTRARHHTAVWWLPTADTWITGLARVLFARDDRGDIDPVAYGSEEIEPIDVDESMARLEPLVEAGQGALEVVVVDDPKGDSRPWSGSDSIEEVDLAVASLDRRLDRARHRLSFSAITARGHDRAQAVDPFDDTGGDDRATDEGTTGGAIAARSGPDTPGADSGRIAGDRSMANSTGAADEQSVEQSQPEAADLPLGDIAGGAGFGNLVHEVLEIIDFTAADLPAEIEAAVADRLAWNPWPVDKGRLVAGLVEVVRTPLGPLFEGLTLSGLPRGDRLDEMTFDLTLGEGGVRCSDTAVGNLLLDHLPADDPLRPWSEKLATGPFTTVLAGHLTGSIDLVARVHGEGGADRFVVCDYKTNRLAPSGVTPTSADFRPDRLPGAMAEHDYPLQALLYSVALHRYLRWRITGYDPAVHLGGVGYLFVRGMVGPETPTTDGVPNGLFDWRPPARLITELSDLLDGTEPESGQAR